MTKMEKTEKITSHKKEKEKAARRGQNKPPTKIIIRHLPPTMLEEDFLKQIDPMPEHDDYYFVEADWSLGYDATCRAYITFKNYDDVFLFRDRFDGYVFVDTKGGEYPAIVEFAPFQGFMDHKSRRKDLNCNTIEQDDHYQQFIKNLEAEREAAAKGSDNKLEFTLDRKKEEKITTTPLLEYLADKREKRREDKKRQREEEREKRRQKDAQQQVTKIISNKSNKIKKDAKSNESDSQQKRQQNQQEQESGKKPSKRARDQKRREEYYARKLERERDRQDAQNKRDSISSKNSTEQLAESSSSLTLAQTSETNLSQDGGSKRYSEKRERHRNRKDKQKSREDVSKSNVERKDEEPKEVAKKSGLSEAVKNFFDNFSEPTAQKTAPTLKEPTDCEKRELETGTQEVQRNLDKLSVQNTAENAAKVDRNNEGTNNDDKKVNERDAKRHELRSQRSAEERRIRNKDRPSIAIYQPKPRLRLSEESNGRDTACSQPTSDCESLRKEEHQQQRTKKVSRYSDRRAEMHAERRAEKAAGGSIKRRSRSDKAKSGNEASDDNTIERTETEFVPKETESQTAATENENFQN